MGAVAGGGFTPILLSATANSAIGGILRAAGGFAFPL